MQINLDKNGWAVTVTDLDLNFATDDDINVLGCLCGYYSLVVLREQNLSIERQEEICSKLGNTIKDLYPEEVAEIAKWAATDDHPILAKGSNFITRVTDVPNKNGSPGMQGFYNGLPWHLDKPAIVDRPEITWLYSVQDSADTTTQFINNIITYNELDDETKETVKKLKIHYSDLGTAMRKIQKLFQQSGYTGPFIRTMVEEQDCNLVHTNPAGQTGIYWHPSTTYQFIGMSETESAEFGKKLWQHISKEQYIYTHHWQDGDVVLNDQWFGLHQRLPYTKPNKRILHRIEARYDHCDFTKLQDILKLVNT